MNPPPAIAPTRRFAMRMLAPAAFIVTLMGGGAGNTPESAIAAYEVARTPSRQFAGPCADTELPRDVGVARIPRA